MSGTVKRTKIKSKRRTFNIRFFVVLALLGAVMVGAGFYRAAWGQERITYARIEPGTITHEQKLEAVFANEETVLQAPTAGKVNFYGKEGERFRRGAGVAQIVPEGAAPGTTGTSQGTVVATPRGGLVFQEIDGLETVLTPNNLLTTDLTKLLGQTGSTKKPERLQAGETFAKVVNNLAPTYAFIYLPKLDEATGKNLTFMIGGELESAKIVRKSQNPLGVVVQFPHFLDGTVQNRHQSLNWVNGSPVQGLLIPKSALSQQGDKEGVYAVQEGVIRFKTVQVLDQDSLQVCVKGLQEGGLVVANPRPDLEGKQAAKN